MQWASLFPWIWRGVISLVRETTLCATMLNAPSSPGHKLTPMTHHPRQSMWETWGPAYFSQKDLQRPSCNIPSDPRSAASEQTSHWHVSPSNCRRITWMDLWELPTSCSNSTMVILWSHWISCRTFSIISSVWMSKASFCAGYPPSSVHS
jgi:hypothetical protein